MDVWLKKLIFLFLGIFIVLLLIQFTDATLLKNGTILNTSVSNFSITFSRNTTIDKIEITPISIYLENITDKHGYVCNINHTSENSNIDSATFICISQEGARRQSITREEPEDVKEMIKEIEGKEELIIVQIVILLGIIIALLIAGWILQGLVIRDLVCERETQHSLQVGVCQLK